MIEHLRAIISNSKAGDTFGTFLFSLSPHNLCFCKMYDVNDQRHVSNLCFNGIQEAIL